MIGRPLFYISAMLTRRGSVLQVRGAYTYFQGQHVRDREHTPYYSREHDEHAHNLLIC